MVRKHGKYMLTQKSCQLEAILLIALKIPHLALSREQRFKSRPTSHQIDALMLFSSMKRMFCDLYFVLHFIYHLFMLLHRYLLK